MLAPATVPILRQSVQLSAMHGAAGPAGIRAGYNMITLTEVDIQSSFELDFLFDLGPASNFFGGGPGDTVAVLVPRGAVGPAAGGLQLSSLAFDSVRAAPVDGYDFAAPILIRPGDVLIAASRQQRCTTGGVESPRYAKLSIEAVDAVARTVSIVLDINPNCGYRSLEPGIPAL